MTLVVIVEVTASTSAQARGRTEAAGAAGVAAGHADAAGVRSGAAAAGEVVADGLIIHDARLLPRSGARCTRLLNCALLLQRKDMVTKLRRALHTAIQVLAVRAASSLAAPDPSNTEVAIDDVHERRFRVSCLETRAGTAN